MKNIKVLQKIRTYVKNKGMVDFFISKELDGNDNIIRKEIKKIESYPKSRLKNKPIRFVFFKCNNFYILLQSKYLKPTNEDNREGNFITHSLVLENKIDDFNPIDYVDSNCFRLDYEFIIKKEFPKNDLSFFNMVKSIPTPNNNIIFSENNKILLIGLIISSQEKKSLVTISNNINPILKELMQLLPPNIRTDITFSNLEFSKISEKKIYTIYNYSEYSLNLNEMNSYKNFNEIKKDAEKINYLCFNYEDNIFSKIETEKNRYVNFIFNNNSIIETFYKFTEKYNYSLSELDILTLLFQYESSNINLTVKELEDIIIFIQAQNNEKLLKKLFTLIYTKHDYIVNFNFFVYFLGIFEIFFSKEEFIKILYSGIEKALYDRSYHDIDLLFQKLFKIYDTDRKLKIIHNEFINNLILKRNSKKLLKNILVFNNYTFSILGYELNNNYFEFIAHTDKDTLIKLITFYEDKRFPKSLILLKYNQQNIKKYLFRLLEEEKLSIYDLARYKMNREIKDYFDYKRNQIISKNFLKKMIPFQQDELSLLEEFNKKLVENDILYDLIEIVISSNKSNFPILTELYRSYPYHNEKNKELIFKNLNNILEKNFSKFYNKIDFLNELHSTIKPYRYLLTGFFIHNINQENVLNLTKLKLEKNEIPLNIIKHCRLDKKILKVVQKKYDNTVRIQKIEDKKLKFEDLLMIRIFD